MIRQLHAGEDIRDPRGRELGLGEEPASSARREAGTVVAAVPAGGQHDRRGVHVAGELLGDLESVEIGQLHVQQDEVGAQGARGCDRAQPVLGLADDVVPLQLEEPACRRPEGGVIVDDEDACSHKKSVSPYPFDQGGHHADEWTGNRTLTWAVIVAARGRAHMAGGARLARAAPAAGSARRREAAALDVVRDITGLHAQLMSSAELTLWARVDGLERGAVDARAVGGPHAGQDVGDARHAAPPARGRARALGGRPGRAEAAPPRAVVAAPSRPRRARRPTRCSTRSRPRSTAAALTREAAGRRGRARERRRGSRRQAARRLRRSAQARRVPRRPVLRPQRGPQRAVHAAGPVAGAAAAGRSRRGDARGRAPLSLRLRTGNARDLRPLVRRHRRPPRPGSGSPRSGTRWSRSRSRASAR